MTIQGIIGKKLGMTEIYGENGILSAVTAIEAGPCVVTQVKTAAKEGYNSVQLGFGETKRLNSPERGHLKGLGQYRHLRELRVESTEKLEAGLKVDVTVFKAGDIVDVTGITKGKGFAGVMKRHHFHGGPKTHGQSDRQRHPGAISSTTTPGHVFKGLRMAGHMGNRQHTVRGLQVVTADPARNLLLVKGAVPGADNGLLIIKKSSRSQ